MSEDNQELVCRALADCGALDGLLRLGYWLVRYLRLKKKTA